MYGSNEYIDSSVELLNEELGCIFNRKAYMEMIQIAIVGGGRGGESLIRLFQDNEHVNILCVIDLDINSPGAILANEIGIPVYDTIEYLRNLNDYNLVINVTGVQSVNDDLMKIVKDPSTILNSQLSTVIYSLLIKSFNLNNELEGTRTYLENIIDNSRDMIITTDSYGNIVRLNRGGSIMLGYDEKEVQGKPVSDFYYDSKDRENAMEAIKTDGFITNYETRLKKKNGDLINISLTLTPLYDQFENYIGTVGVSKDITNKIRNERIIKEKNEQLEELTNNLEKLVHERTAELEKANERLTVLNQYRSQFIANMSHELRTPLNSIIGFSEILADGSFGELNKKQLKYANNINKSGHHLLQIINDILDLSKIDAGKMELNMTIFDLNDLVKNSMFMFDGTAAKKQVELKVEVDEIPVFIQADMGRIKQVLFNLISNAVKFTPSGGSVTIKTELFDDQIKTSVIDTGIGIPEEHLSMIFNEFEQVDNSYSREYEGTGLGLPLVKRFLEMHDSTIKASSKPDEGSEFSFFFKRIPGQKEEELRGSDNTSGITTSISEIEEVIESSQNSNPLILVVDDDPGSLELMTLTLAEQGYRTAHAKSGKEAVDKVYELMPDAITLDIMLPGMDGWEVIQKLKADERTADIPIVIVTMTDNRNLAFTLGAVDFAMKPIDRNRFKRIMGNIIEQHYYGREYVSILAVDDIEDNLLLIADITSSLNKEYRIDLRTARGGLEALDKISESKPDLVILDLMMPEVTGFDVVERLKENEATAKIPIIILTAMTLSPRDLEFLERETSRVFRKSEMNISTFLQEIQSVIKLNKANNSNQGKDAI